MRTSLLAAATLLTAIATSGSASSHSPTERSPTVRHAPKPKASRTAPRTPAIAKAGKATLSPCARPQGLPAVRRAGVFKVESPPRHKPERWLRLRTHQGGSWLPKDGRHWEGPEVPLFVPLTQGGMELSVLDPIAGGYLAFYRSAPKDGDANADFEVRLFACNGRPLATLPLNPLLSRASHLEVQDVRYADGTVYFNEACQSYSRQAGGLCSRLVAADPSSRKVLWRTLPLVSNNVFRVVGGHLVAGYGFTGERAFLRVIRRSDGRVVQQLRLPKNHFALEPQGQSLNVELGGSWQHYKMTGFDTPKPRLVPMPSGLSPNAGAARSSAGAARSSASNPARQGGRSLDPGF